MANIFFEQFDFMYEFKFLSLVGFIQIFDEDFEIGKFVSQGKEMLLEGDESQESYLQ